MYKEIEAKIALNRIKREVPAPFDLNIYRGCAHRCQYCYALYSHRYLESDNFYDEVFVKTNIATRLDAELSRKRTTQVINIGGVCDSYQPVEKKYKLMREVLEVLIKHQNPIILATKSTLILRDLDLIKRLAAVADVNIAASLTTLDEDKRIKLEPFSAPPRERLAMLRQMKDAGTRTTMLMMPILPYLTDTAKNFDDLFKEARKNNVESIVPGMLNLRSATKSHFLNFLKTTYPELYPKYIELYSDRAKKRDRGQKIRSQLMPLFSAYDFPLPGNNTSAPVEKQQRLF